MTRKTKLNWAKSYRIVASRFPPIGLFEQATTPDEIEALAAIEGLTNDRLNTFHLLEHHVPRSQWLTGHGTSPIMAAFTHVNPDGSRFCDGTFGAYYAGDTLETAIDETLYHQQQFCESVVDLQNTPSVFEKRVYVAAVRGEVVDLSGLSANDPVFDPDDYQAGQQLGRELKHSGAAGIHYPSVRHDGGHCVAALTPRLVVPPAVSAAHLQYRWDGERVINAGRLAI